MLLFALALLVIGYTFVYAAVRGDNASINGTPLWKAPWLPFIAAFSGTTAAPTSYSPSKGTGSYGSTSVGANQAEASANTLLTDLQRGAANLRTGVLAAFSKKSA